MEKLLIGIMEHGEQEFKDCLRQLYGQQADFDFFLVQNQPNKLAHRILYANFEKNRNRYLGCMCLDADMVIQTPQLLDNIHQIFTQKPNVKKIVYLLHDYLSDHHIPGCNIFHRDVPFYDHNDRLIPDIDAHFQGDTHVEYGKDYKTDIVHMANPNYYQCYRYGLQRAMKILQLDRKQPARAVLMNEYTILIGVFYAFKNLPDIKRAFCMQGAMDFIMMPNKFQMQLYKINDYAGEHAHNAVKTLINNGFSIHNPDIQTLAQSPMLLTTQINRQLAENAQNRNNETLMESVIAQPFEFESIKLPAIYPKGELVKFINN